MSAFNKIQELKELITSLNEKVTANRQSTEVLNDEIGKSKDPKRVEKLENKKNMIFNARLNIIYKIRSAELKIKDIQNEYVLNNLS